MRIEIRSELELQKPIAAKPSDKILWINIRSPQAKHQIKLCQQFDELPPEWCLFLRFEDIRVDIPNTRNWTLFDSAMAEKIANFVNQDWDVLIVNCEGGVSRSSAIALAVAERFNLPSPIDDRLHSPNQIVLKILRNQLLRSE
jgi:predicted protein tyrosine phosphatase